MVTIALTVGSEDHKAGLLTSFDQFVGKSASIVQPSAECDTVREVSRVRYQLNLSSGWEVDPVGTAQDLVFIFCDNPLGVRIGFVTMDLVGIYNRKTNALSRHLFECGGVHCSFGHP